MEATITREPIIPTAREIITVIKEGRPLVLTEAQKAYQLARAGLFKPNIPLTNAAIENVLEVRLIELDEAIDNSPLRESSDRNGYPLGGLKELTSLAIQELTGKLNAKTALTRQLEMITNEEEERVRGQAAETTREGLIIGKNGSIIMRSFPTDREKVAASNEAHRLKSNFLVGKQRLQEHVSNFTSG